MASYGISFLLIIIASLVIAGLALAWFTYITKTAALITAYDTAKQLANYIADNYQLMKIVTPATLFVKNDNAAVVELSIYEIFGIPPLNIVYKYYTDRWYLSSIVISPFVKMPQKCSCTLGKVRECSCNGELFSIIVNDSIDIQVSKRIVRLIITKIHHVVLYIPYNVTSIMLILNNYTIVPELAQIRAGSIIRCVTYYRCTRVKAPPVYFTIPCSIIPTIIDIHVIPLRPYAIEHRRLIYIVCKGFGEVTLYICVRNVRCNVA